ncbi:MAG: 50S ribosomal protein L11 methyltransferase [Bacteroidota bacterium]
MQTIEVAIPVADDLQEFLIAELADLDFEAFEQDEGLLRAYIPAARWNDVHREWIEQWLLAQGVTAPIRESIIEPINWNAQWEETIQPVAVGRFLVKPTWAQLPPEHTDRILLEVDPKMSFGTGYHPSTRLMLHFVPDVVAAGDLVMDAGTGTGILAIAAAKVGARHVFAFDVDDWSYENGRENVLINGVEDRVEVVLGGIEVAPEGPFDTILANINLNILLGALEMFRMRLQPGGMLAMAGMLVSDRERMIEALAARDFAVEQERQEDEWWAVGARLTRS